MEKCLDIALLGEPVLRQIAMTVEKGSEEKLRELVENMLFTLKDSGGVGLAAPQVFESTRLIVVASKPTKRYPYAPEIAPTVMLNPAFTPLTDALEKDWEGCLSIPGIRALVPRYSHIQVTFTDLMGQLCELELKGFVARVFQHEFDHLNGMVYLDRVETNRDIISEHAFLKLITA